MYINSVGYSYNLPMLFFIYLRAYLCIDKF